MKAQKKSGHSPFPPDCETCMYYDYDEEYDNYVCGADLDQDEMENFLRRSVNGCPFYRYYDEYKSVQKQN